MTLRERASTDIPSRVVMIVAPAHHSVTPAGVTGHPLSGLGKPPLSGRAVLRAEATQERHKVALQIRGVDPGG